MSGDLSPERVEELANWLPRCRVEDAPNPLLPHEADRIHVAHVIAPLVAGWLAEAEGRVVAVKHDSTCDWATDDAWCSCGLDDAFEAGYRAGAAEVRARVEAALANHPDVCDRYNDEDVVSCGWKSAVIGVRAALATEREECGTTSREIDPDEGVCGPCLRGEVATDE